MNKIYLPPPPQSTFHVSYCINSNLNCSVNRSVRLTVLHYMLLSMFYWLLAMTSMLCYKHILPGYAGHYTSGWVIHSWWQVSQSLHLNMAMLGYEIPETDSSREVAFSELLVGINFNNFTITLRGSRTNVYTLFSHTPDC